MEDDFYATLKFKNGEEVFAKVAASEEKDRTMLVIHHPVLVSEIRTKNGLAGYKVEPWLKTTKEDMFVLRMDKVITMTECHDKKLISIYKQYIEEKDEDDLQVIKSRNKKGRISWPGDPKLGYISSVQKKRESLERIFKSDSKEP